MCRKFLGGSAISAVRERERVGAMDASAGVEGSAFSMNAALGMRGLWGIGGVCGAEPQPAREAE